MQSDPRMREILQTTDITDLSDRDITLMFLARWMGADWIDDTEFAT